MNQKQKKNIIRYRKPIRLNIGIIVFLFVLIYFLVYFFNFLTEKHIAIYEVQKGQIMNTSCYTGLILRQEEVTYSEEAGNINYYKKESDKTGYQDLICSIDKEGSISQEITSAGLDGTTLSKSELLEIQELITDYTSAYSGTQFYNIYSFRDNLNANIQENLYLAALDSLSEQMNQAASSNTFSFVRAQKDGVLAFYTDGYEDVTPDSFSPEMYQPSGYTRNNLKSNTAVSAGQALYKTVADEDWYLMVPLSEEDTERFRAELEEGDDSFTLLVTFKKDNRQAYATASFRDYGEESFLQLAFNSSMVRYLSDRYLEVELGEDDQSGLKIPNTAIVSKEFLLVPADYISQGDNSSDSGVIKVTTDKRGRESVEFVSTDIYDTDEEKNLCYVEAESLAAGDVIQKPDASEQYTLGDTGEKEGVYNMNRGYDVFRMIDPVEGGSNEEYTIVKTGTSYGLSLYDRIALDGTSVAEGEFAN